MVRTRNLLRCGLVAGPLLVVALLAQTLWRQDYDVGTDPISSLSLGRYGWVQIATFIVVGALVAALGAGVWRLREHGTAGRGAGALLVVMGLGLAGVGAFVTDPLAWHGRWHDVATGIAINAGLLAVLVLGVAWWRAGRRAMALYGLATAVACAALGWSADSGTIALRHTGVVVLLAAWLTTATILLQRSTSVRG